VRLSPTGTFSGGGTWSAKLCSSIGEDEEGRVPLRGGAESLADALDEGFAERDGAGRVEGEVGAAFRVDIGELREGTGQCRIARGV
jgi:hypothetical protein